MNTTSLNIGATLRGDTYRIERVLGQGGFGITYLATDLSLDKRVAIKEFFPKSFCGRDATTSHVTVGTEGNEELVAKLKAKFLKEAKNIAKFEHPNIIKIHAAFEENNTAYYVMDYIEGESLAELVKRTGPLPRAKALDYITTVGRALEYVHSLKMNHLDVKPGNIMLRSSDHRPILIDFGLAKQYDAEGNQTSTTPVGISHGYAPNEQYKPGGVSEFSPTTDEYALAATLYYLLTGVKPPSASELVEDGLTFPEPFPNDLIDPISKAMSKERKNRYPTVGQFIAALLVQPKPKPKPKPRENTGSKLQSGKSWKWIWISLAAVVAVTVCILWISKMGNNDETESTSTEVSASLAPTAPDYNGHEYVDLGLSVKWATCNVGASSPSDYGDYFAWGETSTKVSYDKDNSVTFKKNLGDIAGNPSYDAARANWGGSWRLPTKAELHELIDKCTWEWTTIGGRNGYRVTSKSNGNSIFLPAAGWRDGTSLDLAGEYGNYWSSTPNESYTQYAYILYFSSYHRVDGYNRSLGLPVRPVSE